MWLNDTHRKRGPAAESATPEPQVARSDGPLVAAVRLALAEHADEFGAIERARVEQALLLAQMVENQGPSAVPASKELGSILDSLASEEDEATAEIWRRISTPVYGDGTPGTPMNERGPGGRW